MNYHTGSQKTTKSARKFGFFSRGVAETNDMIRDIRGRFLGKELTEKEIKKCPAECPCPVDFAIPCVRGDEMDCCPFGVTR